MDDFTKFIQALGAMGEMTAIFYNTLLRAGLSEDVAVTLSAKMIGDAGHWQNWEGEQQ